MPIAGSACSATLRVETADGVIYARVGGVVTLAVIEAIRAKMAPALQGARAICLDYTGAVLALTQQDVDVLALAAAPGANQLAIAWVVADEATAAAWRLQALRFALAGLRRMATTDRQAARLWARRQSTATATQQ